ncbi:winged helix-turn-helix domain-containing protein [Paenibacillus faecalis]|uniref:winged helix-turn-helix domain-containing protein n=1 Tax=Paenibacillus faecalis TaxID=2079532 RepID=UPI003078914C
MELGLAIDSYLKKYRYKYLALYHALRDAIVEGMLSEGTRLPATRELSRQYGLSRGAVAQSYDMLLAEGFVFTKIGSGTYVAKGASLATHDIEDVHSSPVLSTWGQRVSDIMLSPSSHSKKSTAVICYSEPPISNRSSAVFRTAQRAVEMGKSSSRNDY